MATEDVVRAAREIDVYVGVAVEATPVGTIAVPMRLLVALHNALGEDK